MQGEINQRRTQKQYVGQLGADCLAIRLARSRCLETEALRALHRVGIIYSQVPDEEKWDSRKGAVEGA